MQEFSRERSLAHQRSLLTRSLSRFQWQASHAPRMIPRKSSKPRRNTWRRRSRFLRPSTATSKSSRPTFRRFNLRVSGQMKLSRPDKLRIRRTGGYADVELTYDGKTLTIYGNNAKSYVQADEPGTVDHVIDVIQSAAGTGMPGNDLPLTNAYDEMMANILDAKHIGQGVVDGVECEHLAFRGRHRLADLD